MGYEAVKESLLKGAKLVIFTSDISDGTKGRILRLTEDREIKHLLLDVTAHELEGHIGRRLAVMSITDGGMADRIIEEYNKALEEDCNDR